MCGLVGLLRDEAALEDLTPLTKSMADSILHRGPDDYGIWSDASSWLILAHRRLAIVDLSAAGHQPMHSVDDAWVMVFNGEIYNHLEIRAELGALNAAPAWRGHSDTETLLAAFSVWGVESTLQRCVGMFAIALWNKQTQQLYLARDRFGEKPLYFGWVQGGFAFASELKAIKAWPGFSNPVSRQALGAYLGSMYVPAPLSIYEGIYKLEPGCLLTVAGKPPALPPAIPPVAGAQHGSLSIQRWWSLGDAVVAAQANPLIDETDALDSLEAQLKKSVQLQSLADVPLGAFLSGGVDSSTIVALMQAQSSRSVKTFTVGFEEAGFDESPHAKAVAQYLGTDHTELFVTAAEAQAVIPQLPWMYDEPFADSSQIPTHLVCKAARQQVTVALSGDAGDELFGGYNRYFWGPRIWNKVSWLPFAARRILGQGIQAVPAETWDALGGLRGGVQGVSRMGEKAHKLGARLSKVRNMDDLYASLVTEWPEPSQLVKGLGGKTFSLPPMPGCLTDPRERMMYWDSMTYLPDDILCKVDRAAMATSLETRVPFLDHRVAELAWRLPMNMKIRGDVGKWALRQVLYRHVPQAMIERPKAGFGIPVGQWLRGPLRDWAENLLDAQRLEREGYFHPAPIREVWAQHLSGSHDWTPRLWSILMFQSWLESNA